MKVILLTQYWEPDISIPQRRWTWLADILNEQGHELLVVAPPSIKDRNKGWKAFIKSPEIFFKGEWVNGDNGERILRTGFLPSGRSLTLRAINQGSIALSSLLAVGYRRRGLLDFEPDIIIGTVPAVPTTVAAFICGKLLHTSYVIDLRDAWPDLLNDWELWNRGVGERSWRERLLGRGTAQVVFKIVESVMNYCLKSSSGIMTTSSWLLEKLHSTIITDPEKPSVVIRNVFPGRSSVRDRQTWRANNQSGELRVLYAGTIGRAQKLENVIDSIKLAQSLGVEVKLRMAGDGASRRALQDYASKNGVEVCFLGKLPVDQLEDHYLWSDTALVHLANWDSLQMAIPSKTFELMENRIHITAVVEGETAEIVNMTRAGHVIPPDDPVALCNHWIDLIEHPELTNIRKSGSQWVEHEREIESPAKIEAFLRSVTGKEQR